MNINIDNNEKKILEAIYFSKISSFKTEEIISLIPETNTVLAEKGLNKLVKLGYLNKKNGIYSIVQYSGAVFRSQKAFPVMGKFKRVDDSYGFITNIPLFDADVFAPCQSRFSNILSGDILFAMVSFDYSGRTRADIVEIVKHSNSVLSGRLERKDSSYCFYFSDCNCTKTLKIKDPGKYKSGDTVVCSVTEFEDYDPKNPSNIGEGKILFGKDNIPLSFCCDNMLDEFEIKPEFSDEVLSEAKKVSGKKVRTAGRIDLTGKTILTIDSASAKDLDDAVSLEKNESGYILGVHIADVSEYIPVGSALDKEAFNRGTSIYYGDKVIPMFPKQISNGCCSLNENKDRYTLSVFMTIGSNGQTLKTEVCKSVINSTVKGVYSEINDLFNKGESSDYHEKYRYVYDMLLEMKELYAILAEAADKRGSFEIDETEPEFVLNKKGEPVDVKIRDRGVSERIIEQFMIKANEAVAVWLREKGSPCVYRVHPPMEPDKASVLRAYSKSIGLDVSHFKGKAGINNPDNIKYLLNCAEKADKKDLFVRVLLRSFSKAEYSEYRDSHFGLALDDYAHFTSPIRRYPDLTVHRLVKRVLSDENEKVSDMVYLGNVAKQSTERERVAVNIERKADDIYMAFLMRNYINQSFNGIICSVIKSGFFVKLPNGCEGRVFSLKYEALYDYDKDTLTLSIGKDKIYPGKKVKVTIKDIDVINGIIRMELIK